MQIHEELYIGEVRLSERSGSRNRQYVKALNELVKVEEELSASLNDEQKRLFVSFEDAQREVSVQTDIETFTYAFKLGAKIMLDVLTDTPMKEI